jgi:hypothetical protein
VSSQEGEILLGGESAEKYSSRKKSDIKGYALYAFLALVVILNGVLFTSTMLKQQKVILTMKQERIVERLPRPDPFIGLPVKGPSHSTCKRPSSLAGPRSPLNSLCLLVSLSGTLSTRTADLERLLAIRGLSPVCRVYPLELLSSFVSCMDCQTFEIKDSGGLIEQTPDEEDTHPSLGASNCGSTCVQKQVDQVVDMREASESDSE